MSLLGSSGVQHGQGISHQPFHAVRLGVVRFGAAAVSAQVHGDHAMVRSQHLGVAESPPNSFAEGTAVNQQQGRALPCCIVGEFDAVGRVEGDGHAQAWRKRAMASRMDWRARLRSPAAS